MSEENSIQPDSGQGAEGSSEGFYQSYLDTVPEDYKEHLEPYLKDIEKNANQRFAEHAEYKKSWEPYEELKLNEYDPDGLSKLIEFAELMENPEAFKKWWTDTGQQTGFMDELNADDDDDFDLDEDDPEVIKAAFEKILDDKLKPLYEREFEREQTQEIEDAGQQIDQQIEALEKEHGEIDKQAVLRFAYAYADSEDNPIEKGFADYQNFIAGIEKGTVQRKAGGPSRPEGEGKANTNMKTPDSFEEAKEMAKERLAHQV